MIRAALYGRLGADPVQRSTRASKPMATASLAVNAARYGEPEATQWFSLVAFGTTGEALLRHVQGDLLAAMGHLTKRRYFDRDGQEREGWSLTVDTIVSARSVRPGGRKREPSRRKPPDDQPACSSADGAFDDALPI